MRLFVSDVEDPQVMTGIAEIGIDRLASPEVVENPYPAYARFREASPLAGYRDWPPGTVPGADEPVDAWALFKYEDVMEAVKDPETFSSRDPLQEASSAPSLMLVNHDAPDHTKLRKIVNLAFSPRRVNALEDWLAGMMPSLLDELGEGEVDAMTVAPEVPARGMVRLLGLDEGDHERFHFWANAFMLSSDMAPEERAASNQEMWQVFAGHVDRRMSELPTSTDASVDDAQDLIGALVRAEVDGERFTIEEIIRFCVTLVVAGTETTTYLIGNVLDALARFPEAVAEVRADRSLLGRFIEETMRLNGPPQRLFRIATRDTELGGKRIRQGDWVALFFAAANRDPAVFPDPDAFDLHRPNVRKQLALGHGVHFCLGAVLARLEVSCIANAFLDRFSVIRHGETPPVKQTATLLQHGFLTLPLHVER